tara:strand:- start:88 stop:276 length:189 start_codon:yes stop_codon:yes gene_type:complete
LGGEVFVVDGGGKEREEFVLEELGTRVDKEWQGLKEVGYEAKREESFEELASYLALPLFASF